MIRIPGEVAEWFKAPAWKACSRAIVTRVRIPSSPPPTFINFLKSKIQLQQDLSNQSM